MSKTLKVPSQGSLDFVSLGGLVYRLDPGIIPFRKATECKIHVSGGEFSGADRARAVLRRIVQNVDVLVGNEEDLQKALGVAGAAEAVQAYPQIKIVATSFRYVHSANRHTWSATAWMNGQTYSAPTCELDVYDRAGWAHGGSARIQR